MDYFKGFYMAVDSKKYQIATKVDLSTVVSVMDEVILPTRVDLLKDLEKATERPGNHAHTLIQIHLNDYDDITDYFGMDISKNIVNLFSDWLKDELPTRSSKLYRFGMSKFVIYIISRTKLQDINLYMKNLVNKINKKNFYVNDKLYTVSVSIGVARGRKDLFKKSYLALSVAKKVDKTYVIYCQKDNIEERFLKNIKTHIEIKDAIEDDRVVVFYQPIYNLKTSTIEKYEALMRIKNIDGSYRLPLEFLEIAKKVRLYSSLTKRMIKIVIDDLVVRRKPVTINLTVDDIEDTSISRYIYNNIKKSNLAHLITIEITETSEINSFLRVKNFIKKMKELGCSFAIDDFGSGYSNFDHILKLDIDILKIDGSLVKNIDTSKESEIFVKTIINFAKEIGIQTVAEYVYNKSVYDKVNSLGIDYVQGYFIGKPKAISI
jgi:diguanylate cyclase (GGDEF)-like protein